MDRAWVLFRSGSRIDLLNPRPDAWTDSDLAIGLSRTYRWGGHSTWELPLSVAQHSLTVLAIREATRSRRPLTPAEAMRELLHDATEGLLGFDPITPLKPVLGAGYHGINSRLQAAINQRYDLPAWTVASHREHKAADRLAAASEAHHVVGWRKPAVRKTLGIEVAPLDADPVDLPEGVQPWEPWPPYVAADRFLSRLQALQHARAVVPARRAAA